MILEEYIAKDTCNKNRLFVKVECEVCKTIFTRQKRLMRADTCSVRCSNVLNGRTVKVICAHCNKEFFRSISHATSSKSGLNFCSRICKDTAQTYNKAIQPDHYGTGKSSYREKAFRFLQKVCIRCGYSNIDALEVHHIDKNRDNNDISNLEILCANCHTLEHKGL